MSTPHGKAACMSRRACQNEASTPPGESVATSGTPGPENEIDGPLDGLGLDDQGRAVMRRHIAAPGKLAKQGGAQRSPVDEDEGGRRDCVGEPASGVKAGGVDERTVGGEPAAEPGADLRVAQRQCNRTQGRRDARRRIEILEHEPMNPTRVRHRIQGCPKAALRIVHGVGEAARHPFKIDRHTSRGQYGVHQVLSVVSV
ncbi:MAG: hypothetical protein R3E48_11285 [Burkholderiaceae bacterium]